MTTTKRFGLCKGRHPLPVNDYIFDWEIQDPTDLKTMRDIISEKLRKENKIIVYVTGLTVALVEVINYCCLYGIELTLYHYDKVREQYFKQKVETRVDCEFIKEAGYSGYSNRV